MEISHPTLEMIETAVKEGHEDTMRNASLSLSMILTIGNAIKRGERPRSIADQNQLSEELDAVIACLQKVIKEARINGYNCAMWHLVKSGKIPLSEVNQVKVSSIQEH